MKFLLVALMASISCSAFADHLNIYCGKGAKSATVDAAELSLVSEDGKASLYLKGILDRSFRITRSQDGTLVASNALASSLGFDKPHIEYWFVGNCDKQTVKASKKSVGGMVGIMDMGTLPCLCEAE